MKSKVQTGRDGEELAARYLQNLGYEILQRNYCVRGGEIDIIASDKNSLIFVEVKSQHSQKFGPAETWVDERKQHRLGQAAERYLMEHPDENLDCRFDVICIDFTRKPPHIRHLQDAFWLEE